MASKGIELAGDRDVLPFSAEPLGRPTEPTLAGIAVALDRIIHIQVIIADHQDQLSEQIQAIKSEMASNINAYMGWAREMVEQIKVARHDA